MRASPILNSLNAGELSPNIDGRTDLQKYFSGAKRMENFLPLVQGPALRRGGSRYVAEVKTSANRGWLIKFEFSATQAYNLEFGDLYVRFYTSHGQLLVSGVAAYNGGTNYVLGDLVVSAGVNYYCKAATVGNAPPNATYWYPLSGLIYEIPSPYALADLTNADGTCALKIEQSGDVLYIANQKRTYAPRKLTRMGTTNWQFSVYQPNQGPFLEKNSTSATTIYASASTGSVTLTASAALFAATDVGRLVRLQVQDLNINNWEATHVAYVIGNLVRFDGKTYAAVNNATSGSVPPTHEQGSAYDGQTGGSVLWAYQDSGYGIARITAFTASTIVTASVVVDELNGLNQLPANVVGAPNATKRWSLGAWSATTEYPAVVRFFRNRLWWGGKVRFWGTVPNDYENMTGDLFGQVTTDCAMWLQLTAQDVNDILFMQAAQRLVIGTGGGEFTFGENTTTAALGPANYRIDPATKKRVRAVPPLTVGNSILYVQRAGRKLQSLDYQIQNDSFVSTDLAVLSDLMTRTGIIDMAYQGEPYSIIWCVLSNGKLIGFTYDKEQEVTGWHRHPIGGNGFVESVVVSPVPDGSRDEVWLIVKRTINGVTKRYIEYMERPWESADEDGTGGDPASAAFYVDAGLTYSGASTTTISGLTHLEGQTVQVLVDGSTQPDKVVTGGAITLDRAGSVVNVGLQCTARIVTMRLEAGGADGTSQGQLKRIDKLVVRFLDTAMGKCGLYGGKLDDFFRRTPATPMGAPEPFRSTDITIDFPGDYEQAAQIEIRQEKPVPMTIAAIMPRMRTYP